MATEPIKETDDISFNINPSTLRLVVGLLISVTLIFLNRIGHPASAEMKKFIGDNMAKFVDGLLTIGGIVYGMYHHFGATATAENNGVVKGVAAIQTALRAGATSAMVTAVDPRNVTPDDPDVQALIFTDDEKSTAMTNSGGGKIVPFALFAITLIGVGGCGNQAASITLREGANTVVTPVLDEYKQIIESNRANPSMSLNVAHAAGKFTDEDIKLREAEIAEYNDLIKMARAAEKKGVFGQ